MTPYAQMEDWYRTHPAVRPFGLYVEWHLQGGLVAATPDYFVMGRAVSSKAQPWRIQESMQVWPREQQDCWYIFAMCGDLEKVWQGLPYELPWIAFNRHNRKELNFVSLPRIRSLCHGKHLDEQTRRPALRSAPAGYHQEAL
jgi:hypothetical protein